MIDIVAVRSHQVARSLTTQITGSFQQPPAWLIVYREHIGEGIHDKVGRDKVLTTIMPGGNDDGYQSC